MSKCNGYLKNASYCLNEDTGNDESKLSVDTWFSAQILKNKQRCHNSLPQLGNNPCPSGQLRTQSQSQPWSQPPWSKPLSQTQHLQSQPRFKSQSSQKGGYYPSLPDISDRLKHFEELYQGDKKPDYCIGENIGKDYIPSCHSIFKQIGGDKNLHLSRLNSRPDNNITPGWYFNQVPENIAKRPIISAVRQANEIPENLTKNRLNLIDKKTGCRQPNWRPRCI